MLSKRTVENAFIAIAIALLAANAALKLVARATISRVEGHENESNHPLWSVERGDVLLQHDSWTRYHLDAAQQWAPLFPEGGIIHLGPEQTPYTVSMMHQLRCLDVLRDQLNRPKSERSEQPARHCLNYIRQQLMCRGDLQLDPYQYPHKVRAVHPHAIRKCKDWRAVYEKVEENQMEYAAWVGRQLNASSSLS
ncbi:uncharacterized protein TRAVEDRAFT_24130 [Trametes versicolor FP-101664 SS1]|uniref:uncharacterized protein n=1 Tax=Trametes versicolor (strain FP-101664) TaxID=717944 RepID=UPI0004622054|nr:uncharacterized protein TRAVEDRAFT_24130 [Trametes versicolor FP-101664 SS1]EIW52671.1 hypothetical protein TRAVEDRAFT_24130 [Trametes versicolor FP-101664 SS1]